MLKIGHEITRPGKKLGAPPVTIPVPEELETVPGIPTSQRELDWYSREYPLESQAVSHRAERDWQIAQRDLNPAIQGVRNEHEKAQPPANHVCPVDR